MFKNLIKGGSKTLALQKTKIMNRILSIFCFALSILILNSGCKSITYLQDSSINVETLKKDVNFLADDKLEGREIGKPGEMMAAEYISKRFRDLGLKPMGDNGTYFQEFLGLPPSHGHGSTSTDQEPPTGHNVIAFLDHGAATTVVIGAHFDHLGYGSFGSLHAGEPEIHNGADDNSSGTSAMLMLAEVLKERNTTNNYLFIAFSGEEMGLWGSNYFCKNPTLDAAEMNYMINLDMVGRLKPEKTLAINGVGTSPKWKGALKKIKTDGISVVTSESGIGPSDHSSFYNIGVPALHFFTGQHADYHKPSDDANKVNYAGMRSVVRYIDALITMLDDDGKLAFTKTKDDVKTDTPRFKVTLGVMPDYLYAGKGMRIDGVTEERPAAKANMKAGDVVVKMGDIDVTDMNSYMEGLSKFEKGDQTEVWYRRDGKVLKVMVTF